jgi:hypothetical protein
MVPANTAVQLEMNHPEAQRRATVAFRGLLAIPQWIALYAFGLAAAVALALGWFAALVTGRMPVWAFTFTSGYVRYQARVQAYLYLLTDQYPPFSWTAPHYPVQLDMPERGRLGRLAVLLRFVIAIPAVVVIGALTWGWHVVGFFVWLAMLVTGRMPRPAFEAAAAMLRALTRFNAWFNLLTDAYPAEGVFGEKGPSAAERRADTRPFVLSRAGKQLLATLIVVGLVAYPTYIVVNQVYLQPLLQHAVIQHLPVPHR